MAGYATATPEQQARVNNFVQMMRAVVINFWQYNNNTNALIEDWNADILGIIGSPTGVTITDGTGYPGAVPLTDTQVTNLFGILQNLQPTIMTSGNQTIFMMATGPNNAAAT